MRSVSLALIIMAGILICGCVTQPTGSSVPNSMISTSITNTTLPSLIAETGIATLDTTHQNVTLSLVPGVYVIAIQAQDALNLDMKLTRPGEDIPVNFENFGTFYSNGPTNGSMSVVISEKGEYQLHLIPSPGMNAEKAPWIAKVAPLPVDMSLKTPILISGTGTMVSPAFSLIQGEYIVKRDSNLLDTPLFTLSYANGTVLTDKSGTSLPDFGGDHGDSPKQSTVVTIPESGTYYLITYTGNPQNWAVSVSPSSKTPVS